MRYLIRLLASAAVILSVTTAANARYAITSMESETLDKLVLANLQEAATLQAELPSLTGHPAVERVWRHMITQHESEAHRLARLDRRLGGSPDLTMPAGNAATGSVNEIIAQTLQAHLDTLHDVEGMEQSATHHDRGAIRGLLAIVRHHISMIRSLQEERGEHHHS